jgi:hypothetical protein
VKKHDETRSNPQRCQRREADSEIRGLGAELADAGTGKTGLHRSNGERNSGTEKGWSMMREPQEILAILAAKEEQCRIKNIQIIALLLSNNDYESLKETLTNKGIFGNPDRLTLTLSGKSYPLYTPNAEKVSGRIGQQEPGVVI